MGDAESAVASTSAERRGEGTEHHRYGILLRPGDPLAPQPPNVKVALKLHQRAALHKATLMEKEGRAHYDVADPSPHLSDPYARRNIMFRGRFDIESSIGILADMVGYGKTLTALSIIANVPLDRIHRKTKDVYSYHHGHKYGHFTVTCDRPEETAGEIDGRLFIHTTLVVVPRGPVYVQWEKTVRQETNLKVLCVDSLPGIRKAMPPPGTPFEQLKAFLEGFDLVLVKSTALKTLMDYYTVPFQQEHPLQAFDRIMIDEAHDIISKMPIFGFRFIWLISATYKSLLCKGYGGKNIMSYAVRDIFVEERMNLAMLKGERDFVTQSFSVPPQQDMYYLCELPANLQAVHPFLNAGVQDRINANDIQGAIRELGGQHETESDIVAIVTRDLERDIRNKQQEIEFIQGLELGQEARDARTTTIQNELNRLQERRRCLMDRVSMLSEKTCSICYDNYSNPIILPCTHVFCGNCLLNWMRAGHVCPECRTPIQLRRLIAIVESKEDARPDASSAPEPARILSKDDTLMKLLTENPEGRFLVFSRCDHTFYRLVERLVREGISHAEMKGSTAMMMKTLQRFREGQLRVIMLNTMHAGSGIDISCATDVILFHSMGHDGVQAIGRAQRVGRTSTLRVHHLCYPNELEESQATAVNV